MKQKSPEFAIDDVFGELCDGVGESTKTAHDEHNGEHAPFEGKWSHFAIAHRRNGDDGHVERIGPRVAFDEHITQYSRYKKQQNDDEGQVNGLFELQGSEIPDAFAFGVETRLEILLVFKDERADEVDDDGASEGEE